jgi:hypothetical protein
MARHGARCARGSVVQALFWHYRVWRGPVDQDISAPGTSCERQTHSLSPLRNDCRTKSQPLRIRISVRIGIAFGIRIPAIARDGAPSVPPVVVSIPPPIIAIAPVTILTVDHARAAIARGHPFGLATARWRRLLSGRPILVPYPALSRWRQVSRRNALAACAIAVASFLGAQWTCHETNQH